MRYEDIGLVPTPRVPMPEHVHARMRLAAEGFARIQDWQAEASRQMARMTLGDGGLVVACTTIALYLVCQYFLEAAGGDDRRFYIPEDDLSVDGMLLCGGTHSRAPASAFAVIASEAYAYHMRAHLPPGIPLIVLCGRMPSLSRLRTVAQDAAAIIMEGAALRGPQRSAALACGHAMRSWLMERAAPNHGIGRSAKIGKEEIAGLIAAMEAYVQEGESK